MMAKDRREEKLKVQIQEISKTELPTQNQNTTKQHPVPKCEGV